MSHKLSRPASLHAGPVAAVADSHRIAHTVGRSFRCAMRAVQSRQSCAWVFAWQELAGATGAAQADRLIEDLSQFARAVDRAAARSIDVLPHGCPGLCRDECLAVSMIAACQSGACPALRACAFALLNSTELEPTLQSAGTFASGLSASGYVLPPALVCNAAALVDPAAGAAH